MTEKVVYRTANEGAIEWFRRYQERRTDGLLALAKTYAAQVREVTGEIAGIDWDHVRYVNFHSAARVSGVAVPSGVTVPDGFLVRDGLLVGDGRKKLGKKLNQLTRDTSMSFSEGSREVGISLVHYVPGYAVNTRLVFDEVTGVLFQVASDLDEVSTSIEQAAAQADVAWERAKLSEFYAAVERIEAQEAKDAT